MIQKTIWMQYLIVGNIFAFILLLGCEKGADIDYIKTVDYIYKNNTGVDLILEVYNSDNIMIKSYNIPNDNSIISNATERAGSSPFYYESSTDKIGQSIIVRFIDGKCLYYDKDIPSRIFNVKEYDNYSEELVKQNEFSLIYAFTETDYLNSINCN